MSNTIPLSSANNIRVSMKQIGEPGFFEALGKLYGANLSPKVAYRVNRVGSKVDSEFKQGRLLFSKIVAKYADKSEDGKILTKDGIPGTFTIPDTNKEAFEKEQAELLDIAFTLKWPKLYLEELDGVTLSARDIAVLEPLLNLPDGGDHGKSDEKEVGKES